MKHLTLLTIIFIIVGCSSFKKEQNNVKLSPIMDKALNDKNSYFYADFVNFPAEKRVLPIGVFDSGTGGLTVLERLLSLDEFDNITGEKKPDGILDFAGEDFSYVADQANMPYGNYSSEGKDDYLRELAVKDALCLLSSKYCENVVDYKKPTGVKSPSKIIVIACNTATAYGLNDINTLLEQSKIGVKVIGVVNAGVNALLDFIADTINISSGEKIDQHGGNEYGVGVLATVGTIASGAYDRTIKESNKIKLKENDTIKIGNNKGVIPFKGNINVVSYGAAGFAEAVDMEPDFVNRKLSSPRNTYRGPVIGVGENDIKKELLPVYNFKYGDNDVLYTKSADGYSEFQLNSAANYARFHLVSLIEKYMATGTTSKLKAVILGCTHYPFLLDTLKTVINELKHYKVNDKYPYKDIIADDFTFIDPAVYTAIECYKSLREDNILSLKVKESKLDAYISVPAYGLPSDKVDSLGNLTYSFKYGRNYGTEEISTLFVPFSNRYINGDNLKRIESRLPFSYNLIKEILN
jgi:Glutamate racemase